MIFYFSGTGNSKWVAKEIAKKTNDRAVDIIDLEEIQNLSNEKQIGFVFPIYAWGIPEPMLKFIKTLNKTNVYTFAICTCGQDVGYTMKKLNKTYSINKAFSIIMPSNYIIGEDVEPDEIILKKLKSAQCDIDLFSEEILERTNGYCVTEGKFPFVKSNIISYGFNKFARRTNPFFVNDNCNSCGNCEKNCPAKAIHMKNLKPTWDKECYVCMRCINNCPKKAIQYGRETENRGRYNLNKYLKKFFDVEN